MYDQIENLQTKPYQDPSDHGNRSHKLTHITRCSGLCLLLNICKNLKLQKVVYSKSASCLVAMVLNVGVHCWGCYIRWLESTSPYYQDTWRTWTGLLHKFFLVGWEEGCCKCNDLVLRMRDFFCSELRNAGTIDITDSLTVHSQIMLEQFDLSCISC